MLHPCFDQVELALRGAADPSGAVAGDGPPVVARFTHGRGRSVDVPGFWDGGSRHLVRFAPDLPGRWTWRTRSPEPGLDGRGGELDVGVPRAGQHGPVRVAGRFHFAHADGTPFRPVGATVYNWLHQDDAQLTATAEAVAAAGFDKLRFMVFPQAGDHVTRFPTLLPFAYGADGRPDPTRPVVAFFRRLDRAVDLLGRLGVQAEVLLLTAYDGGRFGLGDLDERQERVYLRYVVARLSAQPHVWWSLCNEYDLLGRPDARWDAAGRLLAAVDPHDHLRSIHNWVRLFDHNRPWITHASVQLGQAAAALGRASLLRDAYRKPVVLDEVEYEGDVPERWGRLTGRELVHRFWVATASGCYASHGESLLREGGSLHIVEGGAYEGESPPRLAFLRRVLEEVRGAGLDPVDGWWDPAQVVGDPPAVYLQYLGRAAPATWRFRLPRATGGPAPRVGDRYAVDVLDTWRMSTSTVERTFTIATVGRNEVMAGPDDVVALDAGAPLAVRVRQLGGATASA